MSSQKSAFNGIVISMESHKKDEIKITRKCTNYSSKHGSWYNLSLERLYSQKYYPIKLYKEFGLYSSACIIFSFFPFT